MVGLFSYPKRHLKKLIKEGEYEEALEFGNSIEKKYSNDADFYFIMGSIFYILEDAKNALDYFERSIQLDDKDPETWLLKGNIHLFLKEKEKVLDCCNKILDIDPQHKDGNDLLLKLRDL